MNEIEMFDGADASGLVEFQAPLALSPVNNNPIDYDNFYPMEGQGEDDEFGFMKEAGGDGEDFDFADGTEFDYANGYSNAMGRRRRRRRKKREGLGEKILSYTPLGWIKKGVDAATSPEARERRRLRAQARLEAAKSQTEAAKSLGKESKSDIELAKALATPTDTQKTAEQKGGLSLGAKIGIGVGAVAVLGVIAFVVYRKMKAKK